MRALSERQAARCETAKTKLCRCRCSGALHGANRVDENFREHEFFEQLPNEDPHHVPGEAEKKRQRKIARQEKKARAQGQRLLFEEAHQ